MDGIRDAALATAGRRFRLTAGFLIGLLFALPAAAQICSGSLSWQGLPPDGNHSGNCNGTFPPSRCYNPIIGDAMVTLQPGCDPSSQSCSVTVEVLVTFPGNHQNDPGQVGGSYSFATLNVRRQGGSSLGTCGVPGAVIDEERGLVRWGVGCSQASPVYDVTATSCPCPPGPLCPLCPKTRVKTLDLTTDLQSACAEPPPPCKDQCGCNLGGGSSGGGGAGGGGGGGGGSGSGVGPGGRGAGPPPFPWGGPGVMPRYKAGGVGHSGFPGSADWNTTLGRYWSHAGAVRIVEATPGDPSVVWRLDENGTFTRFEDTTTTAVPNEYEDVEPADEYRTLVQTATGWELRGLDGTVETYDAAGRWTRTEDRNGNATVASLDAGGRLEEIVKPDGRRETFSYYPVGDPNEGKLMAITLWGVLDAASRTWTYQWSGDDLILVDRPDGRALVFEYDDPSNPDHPEGYMTRAWLEGDQGGLRLLQAWEYDAVGNVAVSWRGTDDKDDADVVDRFDFGYDMLFEPGETTVTDPLGQSTTFSVDYVGRQFRVTGITGSCPTCGFGPETSFEFDDLGNPHLPTATLDARGTRTEMDYNADGRRVALREAVGTLLERATTWQYDANFPAFATVVEQPSVEPGELRITTQVYDALTGDLTSRTLDGFEGGLPLTGQVTSFTYEASGQPSTVDPPGHGTADETVYHYEDPNLGGQLPTRRTDPLLGDTYFEYDAFNRRVAVVDPNLLRTESAYNAIDQVTSTRRCEVAAVTDTCDTPVGVVLEMTYAYTEFGDLALTVFPEGNAIGYTYDDAGRLTAIERKPDALPASHGERTFYTLDAAGNRILEELQAWDGAAWVTASQAAYEFSTRCRVDKVTAGFPGEESVTEFAYDCNGNLEETWDANHPSAGQTAPASSSYVYDELNRLTSVTQPWGGAGGGNVVTKYGYDVQDHLTSVTDGEDTQTFYEYSDRDLMTQEISEVSGTTAHTYNDHGALETTLDARGSLMTRTLDVLDRVTQTTWMGDASLTVDQTWDDPLVDYSVGRLTAIARHGTSVDYEYDVFGRVTRDGDLTFGYDGNGNRVTIGYPGGTTATYGYDFADRHETLDVQVGADPPRTVVSAAGYLPLGPLASLTLGNGAIETRDFDSRYYPDSIEVAGAKTRTWDYQTDAFGNITQIDDTQDCGPLNLVVSDQTVSTTEVFESCADLTVGPDFHVTAPGDVTLRAVGGIGFEALASVDLGAILNVEPGADLGPPQASSRIFAYQDYQYFLTDADGPWGAYDWTYDRIGNRLSEDDDGTLDAYDYDPNVGATGNLALLDQIQLGVGGIRDYTYGVAGHLEQVAAGANVINFTSDQEGRLSGLERVGNTATMRYDGRSFLERVHEGGTGNFVESTYSSQGTLFSLLGTDDGGATSDRRHVLYFSGRPVGILKIPSSGSETCTFLSADHLDTPFVATDETGTEIWAGGFEPFGRDWLAGTPEGAQENGVFLRFLGQWLDDAWAQASLGAEVAYNVHRWLETITGRYSRPDPLGRRGDPHPYLFALGNPMVLMDPFGLYTIDASCQCPKVDPPDTPGMGFDELDLETLRIELDTWCQALSSRITDRKLRRCLEKSCDRGTIKCDRNCPPGRGGYNQGSTFLGFELVNRTGVFCLNNISSPPSGYLGDVAIHEFAHGCRWDHGDGNGVPFDPGV